MKQAFLFLLLLNCTFLTAQLPDMPLIPKDTFFERTTEVIFEPCGCQCEPEFPGGEKMMYAFIENNLQYPEEAKRLGQSGKVYVTFDVLPDGELSNIQVVQSASMTLDLEAVRVVKSMPQWDNGYNHKTGKSLTIHIRIPVKFTLLE